MKLFRRFTIALVLILGFLGGCSKEPTGVEELRAAGKKAFLNQRYAEARMYFNRALNKVPSDPDLLYFNGLAYKRDYIYDSALTFIKRADLVKPNDPELNREIYDLAKKTENWEYALRAINVLVKSGEPVEKFYSELAEFTARNKQPILAMFWQRKVVARDSTNAEELYRLIGIALALDSLPVAEELIARAERQFGASDALDANRGMLYVHQKNYPEAERMFRTLIARDTANTGYKLNLANTLSMYSEKGKKREALALFKALPKEYGEAFKVDSLITVLEKEVQ